MQCNAMNVNNKKLKFLLCPFPVYGSINPFIGIAQILQNRGHTIVFANKDSFKGKVTAYGFDEIIVSGETIDVKTDENRNVTKNAAENVTCDFLGFYTENGIFSSELSPLEKMRILQSFYSEESLRESKNYDKKLSDIIERIKPNIIIVDGFLIVPSVVKSEIPWVLCAICNPLLMINDIRTPPPNSGLPENDQTEWTHFRDEYYKSNEQIIVATNEWFIKEKISLLKPNQVFVDSPFLNIYQYPLELDYTNLRPLPSKWAQFDSFMREITSEFTIPKQLRNNSGKLIYLSFGTFASINVDVMKRLTGILALSKHQYIVSKGLYHNSYELPDNMWGEEMVNQTQILPLVNLIITHGGNNSICEAFYFGKPLIVMPFCYDQYDNAQRVHEKGFGVRMDPNKCSAEELIDAIERLLNDKELNKRMIQISQRIQNDVKSDKLCNSIESIIE